MKTAAGSHPSLNALLGVAAATGAAAGALAAMRTRRARRARTGRLPVRAAMTLDPICIDAGASVQQAAEALAANQVGALPVCGDHGRLVGVLTDRDVLVRVTAQEEDPHALSVADCLQGEPVALAPDDTLDDAAHRMGTRSVRRMPVVDDGGRPIGILTQSDLAAHLTPQAAAMLGALNHAPADQPSAVWLFHRAYRDHKPNARTAGESHRRAGDGQLTEAVRGILAESHLARR